MKKVLIISSSPRKGNSLYLAQQFEQGAKDAGNDVEFIELKNYNINYCMGCGYCNDAKKCVQKDDADIIIQKMIDSDVIVLATPVYFYTMSAQLKTLIDRTCARYLEISNKEVYYIMTSWDGDKGNLKKTVESLRGFTLDCLEGTEEKGILYGVGVWGANEAKETTLGKQAYDMGKNV